MNHIVTLNVTENTSKYTNLRYVKCDKIINIVGLPNPEYYQHLNHFNYFKYMYLNDEKFIIYHETGLWIINDDSSVVKVYISKIIHRIYILNNLIIVTNFFDNHISIYDEFGKFINRLSKDTQLDIGNFYEGVVIGYPPNQYIYISNKYGNIYKTEITSTEINYELVPINTIDKEYIFNASYFTYGLYKKLIDNEKTIYVNYRNECYNEKFNILSEIKFLGEYEGEYYFFNERKKQIVKGLYINEIVKQYETVQQYETRHLRFIPSIVSL